VTHTQDKIYQMIDRFHNLIPLEVKTNQNDFASKVADILKYLTPVKNFVKKNQKRFYKFKTEYKHVIALGKADYIILDESIGLLSKMTQKMNQVMSVVKQLKSHD